MIWLWMSAVVMVITALTHSILGEKKLITPILAIDAPLLRVPRARKILRFAWHFTTLLMFASAITIIWRGMPNSVIVIIGAIWLAAGLFDAAYTKGEHIGWTMLSLAGLLALFGGWQ